jgi:hypothetical protein
MTTINRMAKPQESIHSAAMRKVIEERDRLEAGSGKQTDPFEAEVETWNKLFSVSKTIATLAGRIQDLTDQLRTATASFAALQESLQEDDAAATEDETDDFPAPPGTIGGMMDDAYIDAAPAEDETDE